MLKFGTDGVRGEFGTELTTSYVAALARAAAKVLQCKLVVIGRDTRESGPVLETAIAQSLSNLGIEVHLMGVAPTPAIHLLRCQVKRCRLQLLLRITLIQTTV